MLAETTALFVTHDVPDRNEFTGNLTDVTLSDSIVLGYLAGAITGGVVNRTMFASALTAEFKAAGLSTRMKPTAGVLGNVGLSRTTAPPFANETGVAGSNCLATRTGSPLGTGLSAETALGAAAGGGLISLTGTPAGIGLSANTMFLPLRGTETASPTMFTGTLFSVVGSTKTAVRLTTDVGVLGTGDRTAMN